MSKKITGKKLQEKLDVLKNAFDKVVTKELLAFDQEELRQIIELIERKYDGYGYIDSATYSNLISENEYLVGEYLVNSSRDLLKFNFNNFSTRENYKINVGLDIQCSCVPVTCKNR